VTYRFRPTEVEAIQIPEDLTVKIEELGNPAVNVYLSGEDWLVKVGDKLVALSPDDFEARIEVVGEGQVPTSTPARKPKLIRKPKTARLAPAPPGPVVPQGTIGQLILEALSEKACTVGELVAHWERKGRVLKKPSVSATLTELKREGRVENNGFGEWRLT